MPFVCCVPGCSTSNELPSAILHRFPNVKEVCKVWLDRIGRSDLKKYKQEELLSKYRICGKHFASNNHGPATKRLNRFSLPTLNLPDFKEVSNTDNSFLDPKSFTYWSHPIQTIVLGVDDATNFPNAFAIKVSDNIEHVRVESDSAKEKESCRLASQIDHDYTTLKEPELEVSHIVNPTAEILMALDENLIPEIVMTSDQSSTLNIDSNTILTGTNNITSAIVPVCADYINDTSSVIEVSVGEISTAYIPITSDGNTADCPSIFTSGCNRVEPSTFTALSGSNTISPTISVTSSFKTTSASTVPVTSTSKLASASTCTVNSSRRSKSGFRTASTASVGTVTSSTGYRSVSIGSVCADYRTATSAILSGSTDVVSNSCRTTSPLTVTSRNNSDYTTGFNSLSASSNILPDSTSSLPNSDCDHTMTTTTTTTTCTVSSTRTNITTTTNTIAALNIASNNTASKKKLEAKTFHFKKTNNLPLIIKSALRQCNFPKGTRLVRAIDYAEKGKAMYKIELPNEVPAKMSPEESVEDPIKVKSEAPVKSVEAPIKITADEAPIKISTDEAPFELTPDEIPVEITNVGSTVEINVSSENKMEISNDKSQLTNLSNLKNIHYVVPQKSNAEGPILKLQYQPSAKKLPLSSLDNQLLEVFDSGIWELPNGRVFNPSKIKNTEFFRNLTNAVSQVIKVKNQRRVEMQRKRRLISQKNLKERLRHVLLRQLREEHNVIEEELASKYVDTLYHSIRMNSSPAKLLFIQHKLSPLKRAGRRYTTEDKIFALKLYKSIGKTHYKNLESKLPLPARSSMFLFLNKVPFSQGLNRQVFENLKKSTIKLSEQDRYCSLIFDEHVLAEDDKTEFVGQNKWVRPNGDHVLVFMLRGALRNWKQPIAYLVNVGGINNLDLVQLIKEAIQLILEIGLKPVATIFNTKNSFVEAINHLKMETECYCLCNNVENTYFGFLVGNVEIVPILSPFHLLKLTRDTLLGYDIEYVQSEETKVASWEHILQLYSCDQGTEYLKVCPRLLEQYVIPKKINPATINSCSEIFSQRVSAVMKKLATLSADGIESRASETADFLLLMDQILDSINGTLKKPPLGKPYKCVVNANSSHLSFWAETIEIISTWKYLNGEMNYTALTIGDNWIASLLAYVYIVNKLLKEDVKEIPIRNFTNGPLDNFFENLRTTDSQKPKNPTYHSFFTAYRSFVLGNDLLHTCFLRDDDDSEVPLDIIRDYIYDEGAIGDDDCPMGSDCCSTKDQETQIAESELLLSS